MLAASIKKKSNKNIKSKKNGIVVSGGFCVYSQKKTKYAKFAKTCQICQIPTFPGQTCTNRLQKVSKTDKK